MIKSFVNVKIHHEFHKTENFLTILEIVFFLGRPYILQLVNQSINLLSRLLSHFPNYSRNVLLH
jgi:hypothetical protein